jgi:hypothetical protein
VKFLAVLLVMLDGMAREDSIPGPEIAHPKVPRLLVHQAAVDLMLDQRHQHDEHDEPG